MKPWTYEGYWSAVFGARTPLDVILEKGRMITGQGVSLDEWIGFLQAEAWMQGGEGADQPPEWTEHRERAHYELSAALEAMK